MNFNCIKRIIENLKRKYKTTSPYELAESLDIVLIIHPLGNIWGMYEYRNKNKIIFLNSDLDENQKRYVLSHEIGHAVLHPKVSCSFTNTLNSNKLKKEYEANIFASEFLIDFTDIDYSDLNGFNIEQLSSYYYVPVELMEFKFKHHNIYC